MIKNKKYQLLSTFKFQCALLPTLIGTGQVIKSKAKLLDDNGQPKKRKESEISYNLEGFEGAVFTPSEETPYLGLANTNFNIPRTASLPPILEQRRTIN